MVCQKRNRFPVERIFALEIIVKRRAKKRSVIGIAGDAAWCGVVRRGTVWQRGKRVTSRHPVITFLRSACLFHDKSRNTVRSTR